MKKTTLFKQYLLDKDILLIPVAHDPLGGKIIERAGFKVVGCAGYANSAAFMGVPDIELLTLTNMVDCVWRMCDAVDLPVWADGDNGHGNVTNVQHDGQANGKGRCGVHHARGPGFAEALRPYVG